MERLEQRTGRKPQQIVADAGYTSRAVIEEMAERKMDFLGSMPREDASTGKTAPNRLPPNAFVYQPEANRYLCPGGKLLRPQGRHNKKKARRSGLPLRSEGGRLPRLRVQAPMLSGNQQRGRGLLRLEESAAVLAFRKKMASTEAQKQYSRRGRSWICHAWIKSKLGLRQFHVRGLMKVRAELLWACLTYNLQHWIRLGKLKTSPALG